MAHSPIFLMWAITFCPNIVPSNSQMLLKDWYQEFLCMSHVWSHLTCIQWQGQASVHNVDSILSHCRLNSLAVYFPTCPKVRFNVFREFLASLSPTQRLALSIHWCQLKVDLSVCRHKVTKFLWQWKFLDGTQDEWAVWPGWCCPHWWKCLFFRHQFIQGIFGGSWQ